MGTERLIEPPGGFWYRPMVGGKRWRMCPECWHRWHPGKVCTGEGLVGGVLRKCRHNLSGSPSAGGS